MNAFNEAEGWLEENYEGFTADDLVSLARLMRDIKESTKIECAKAVHDSAGNIGFIEASDDKTTVNRDRAVKACLSSSDA